MARIGPQNHKEKKGLVILNQSIHQHISVVVKHYSVVLVERIYQAYPPRTRLYSLCEH